MHRLGVRMNDEERKRHEENTQFLTRNAEFLDLPRQFQSLVLKSSHASADFKEFFSNGGRLVADPSEPLAAYRSEPHREIIVNKSHYEFAKTQQGAHLVAGLFSRMAHEVGHDKDRHAVFPVDASADDYVQFRSEKEARAIFNAFPIFADLSKSEPSFRPRWSDLGYSTLGLDWPRLYDGWKDGSLDDASVIKAMAKIVVDQPYTRADGLEDQNRDGRLTQRDLYLRDYQRLLRPSPSLLSVHPIRTTGL